MDFISRPSSTYSFEMPETPPRMQHSLRTQPSLLSKKSILRISSLDSLLQAKEREKSHPVSSQSSQRSIITNINEKEKEGETRKMFRSTTAEVGFCLSMALTQLLAVSFVYPSQMPYTKHKTGVPNLWLLSPSSNNHEAIPLRYNDRL